MTVLIRFAAALLAIVVLAFVLPLTTHALYWMSRDGMPARWSAADWSSTGLLPADARAAPQALVRVYAARTGRWRGIVAHHSWIVVKEAGAPAYTRFDKVGWGSPIRVNGWAPDGRWYSNPPELVLALDGAAAERAIPALRAAVEAYPWSGRGDYRAWPGPNSNTFVAFVLEHAARERPELAVSLPPTALGKDWSAEGWRASLAAGGAGLRLSWSGLAGVTIGRLEGVEINLAGLVAGLDVLRPAIKLPGWGRIGLDPVSPHPDEK
ncbi:DUF3750 domain-containing protein [Salinarimonas ramus]|uniref:DUF3750 domain-containing protein n=1 Tax=Salinarimonas ramus TaxID=690164 RepID=A0A917Q8U7_9HYPH|nr:DUF3750 domain-containing protein [Salinarimonas ramus]GGK35842.1 hypothetical protein GCM10011322_23510 [Salinarimonas ramus]